MRDNDIVVSQDLLVSSRHNPHTRDGGSGTLPSCTARVHSGGLRSAELGTTVAPSPCAQWALRRGRSRTPIGPCTTCIVQHPRVGSQSFRGTSIAWPPRSVTARMKIPVPTCPNDKKDILWRSGEGEVLYSSYHQFSQD